MGSIADTDAVKSSQEVVQRLQLAADRRESKGDIQGAVKLREMAIAHADQLPAIADAEMTRAAQASAEINSIRSQVEELRAQAGQQQDVEAQRDMLFQADEMDMRAATASALVKISRGRENLLTSAEQVAIQVAEAEGKPVMYHNGQGTVITDHGRQMLESMAPTAASYTKLTETQRIEQLAKQAQQKDIPADIPAAEQAQGQDSTGAVDEQEIGQAEPQVEPQDTRPPSQR